MASTKLSADQLARFQRLFRGRETSHGEYRKHQGKENRTAEGGPTTEMFQRHLQGTGFVLGIIPVTQENICYFGGIDLDDDAADHAAIAGIVEHAGLPLVVCRSKSGGCHLYLFLKDPAPAGAVRAKLKAWVDVLKLQNPEKDTPGKKKKRDPVEVFPKSAQYTEADLGNWINIPYYDTKKTLRYAVNSEGEELSFDEFLDYAEEKAISSFELEAVEAGGFFGKGPPCLEELDEVGYSEGSRNMGLMNVAILFKAMAPPNDPDAWHEQLRDYNEEKFDPPLSRKEVDSLIKSVGSRDYHYKCDELPIQPYCKKAACNKREFGIKMFKRKLRDERLPDLENPRKVTTDPPRWLVSVNGQDVDLMTEDLLILPRFRRAVLEKVNTVFPMMSQGDWDMIVSKLLTGLTIIEAPPDAGVHGQFRQLLNDFLFRRHQTRSKEDLLTGMPVPHGPKVYFRGQDLWNFLQRKHFRDYTQSKLFTVLREMGAGHQQLNVKKQCVQVWFIDAPQDEQQEEFSPVDDEEPAM